MTQLVCPTREQLTQFDSGQLSDEAALPIGEHLDECESCRSLMETINNLDDTLASALRHPFPDDAHQDESGLRRAESLIQAIGREPLFAASPAAPAEQLQSGRIGPGRIGPYQLLEELGRGGMGTVYKALHTQLDKVVAVKVLPADKLRDAAAVNRFRQEMKAVGRLEHRHIVRATDAGETAGVHFLVMEYVAGIDLSQLVRRLGPLSIPDACELSRQAALGLQYAHEQQLVHRDIKPANLMLSDVASRAASAAGSSPEPIVKVLDLGLARLREEQVGGEHEPLTATGQLMGTLEYMAPEQGDDTHSVDIRADIYSLGATLFKLLTGTAPFPVAEFGSPMKMFTALATQPAPSIRTRRDDLPPELIDVVDKMLARDPADRFATPAEVAQALTPFAVEADLARLLADVDDLSATVLVSPAVSASSVADQGDTAVKTPSPSRAPSGAGSSPRRKRILALATLLAGIMVIAGITLFLPTKNGVIKIEINDPAVQVRIDNGSLIITQKDSKQSIALTPGDHTLSIKQGDLNFETDRFTLKKGDKLLLRVERLPGKIQVVQGDKVLGSRPLKKPAGSHPPLAAEWRARVAKLSAAARAGAIKAELLRRNPGFQGQIGWKTTGDNVTDWTIALGRLDDLAPLLVLDHLKTLEYTALEPRADAVVLRQISSLEFLNGRSAATYRLAFPKNKPPQGDGVTPAWIKQVRALPVNRRIKAVLAKLQELNPNFDGKYHADRNSSVARYLQFDNTAITDITPLAVFAHLERLALRSPGPETSWLRDLSPLKGMPLTRLGFDQTTPENLRIVRGIKTLKTINDKPAAAFWQEMDAQKKTPKPAGKKQIGWQRTIDDGDAGYSEVSRKGSLGWQSSQDAKATKQAYRGDYRYNEDGAATAHWTFSDLPSGRYEVFVTWTALPNRARKAVYVVYDGKQGNKPSLLDQRQSPEGVRAGGFWWKSLGKYQISRGMLAVELDARISSGGGVIADAVRIVRIK